MTSEENLKGVKQNSYALEFVWKLLSYKEV